MKRRRDLVQVDPPQSQATPQASMESESYFYSFSYGSQPRSSFCKKLKTDDETLLSRTSRSSGRPATTTTITTVNQKGGTAVSETITHVGANKVASVTDPSTGTLLLQPIPARGRDPHKIKTRRSRKTIFTPRTSHFDRDNLSSAQDVFRGFWTLFWIVLATAAIRTVMRKFEESGGFYTWDFAELISEDAMNLAMSDAIMVGSTLLCVPFVKLILSGWIRYYGAGLILQHIGQAGFLAVAVRWTFHRQWPWVQSGFLTLHTLSMLMKVHSYIATNGELSERLLEMKRNEKKLAEVLEASKGGWEAATKAARENWEKSCRENPPSDSTSTTTSSPSNQSTSSLSSPVVDAPLTEKDVSTLRHRTSQARRHEPLSEPQPTRSSNVPRDEIETLTWHPEEEISHLAIAIAEDKEHLTSNGPQQNVFPNNVGFLNFIDYLLIPTLVYELEYPRTKSIRPLYILEKTAAMFGTFTLLVLIVEHGIYPVMPYAGEKSFVAAVLDLAVPFTCCYLLIFFIIFECICNVFAEATSFSDRAFYSDWWNSTTFDEFSRKWNVPVHTFLLRHVYSSTMTAYKFSKFQAAFVTFFLSACVHELVMAVVTKKIRMYLFVMQMAQLPLIMIGRIKLFRDYPALGNLFFWLGLLSGFPLLAVGYIRY
ncbi:uncharacterized protein JCM6883_001838 [Sporobolomyces salmoneus]|uniref:uncharacterized protein n=1 Tax=Sporobolomyces salmoneus TaxID=183962 RepID=UPI00316BF683